jgi:hypothetical protein
MFSNNNGVVPGSNTPNEIAQRSPNILTPPKVASDKAAILAALAVFHTSDHVIELRAIYKRGRKRIDAGYYDSANWTKLADHAIRLSQIGAAVYITLNPVDPQLLGRFHNRIEDFAATTTTDQQIVKRRWLLIDLDPTRPTNTSATDPQLEAAHVKAQAIYKFQKALGWSEPVVAKSGNGYHLLYAIDLPNDDESTALLRAVLKTLAKQFDDDQIKVDQSVYNASRICKLYGTVANKGDDTVSTPWRLSTLLRTPARVLVTIDQLRMILPTVAPTAQIIAPTEPTTTRLAIDTPFNLEDFLARHDLDHSTDQHDGRERFKLAICPFNSDHVNGESAIFRETTGKLGFKCHHESCKNYNWKTLRERLDGPQLAQSEHRLPMATTTDCGGTNANGPNIADLLNAWPAPSEIKSDLPVAPEFDANILLPPRLAEFALDEADRMRCAPDFIAAPLIGCLGAANLVGGLPVCGLALSGCGGD